MKSWKINADIYITADSKEQAEKQLEELLDMRVDQTDINETELFEETDDSLCFMCEKRPKQEKNDMCPQCWNEFLERQEKKGVEK